jgi:hypothetical protein
MFFQNIITLCFVTRLFKTNFKTLHSKETVGCFHGRLPTASSIKVYARELTCMETSYCGLLM